MAIKNINTSQKGILIKLPPYGARENMQKNIKQGQQKSGEPQRASTSREAAGSQTYQEDRAQAVTSTLNTKIKKQSTMIKMIRNQLNEILEDNVHHSHRHYGLHLKSIQQQWKSIQTLHCQIWDSMENIDPAIYNYDAFIKMESQLNSQIALLEDKAQQPESIIRSSVQNNISNNISPNTKLPHIKLPQFNGDHLMWRQFRDLFTEIVDRQSIPECQKMWYLKTSLSGEAESLIKHFSATASNYAAAWQLINDRYENVRLLVTAVLTRLLTQPHVTSESPTAIKLLHDTTQECLLSLQGLGIETKTWDPILMHVLVEKLSKTSHALWEQSLIDPKKLPTISSFLQFLQNRFQGLQAIGSRSTKTSNDNQSKHGIYQALSVAIQSTKNCIACKLDHPLYRCPNFEKMTPNQRLSLIQRNKHCVNCLKSGHNARTCPAGVCSKCQKKHNTMLHLDTNKPSSVKPQLARQVDSPGPISVATVQHCSNLKLTALLSTLILSVKDQQGRDVLCRAVLDNGSQANFVSTQFATKLGLKRSPCFMGIEGIGQIKGNISERINIEISSNKTGFKKRIEAHILPKIISPQPRHTINIDNWKIPKNIQLADPEFNQSKGIDLLLGSGLVLSSLSIGQISLGEGLPLLQNTVIGWIIGGEYTQDDSFTTTCGISIHDESLNDALEKFWQLEEGGRRTNNFTAAEQRCENQFIQHTRRSADGRFVVRLPYQLDPNQLGQSKDIALQRFHSMERKLSKDQQLKLLYTQFMEEYEKLGHMREICVTEIDKLHYFLPHHAVLKPDSSTTKLRVVFDASAKTSTNRSLNDVLAKGPTIQDDVFTILMRFRLPRYVFTADVEKMYRQIWIDEQDRNLQLIWWRTEPHHPLKCYQLATVTYGTSAAPYLAIRTLRALADEQEKKYPLAAETIRKNFYVDDVLAGSDKLPVAIEMQKQLLKIMRSAGFKLRKWCANHPKLLCDIPKADQEVTLEFNEKCSENIKTMGLIWHPTKDDFVLRVGKMEEKKITKRTVLSDTAHIFDPLGFVSPVTSMTKIFLQKLWQLKLDWDAALPQDLHSSWMAFRSELPVLQNLHIPRHIFGHKTPGQPEVHIFADASERAYGAVAYMRITEPHNVITVRFLCSKSRVAPVKQITLPRLELCAAKVATEIVEKLQESEMFQRVKFFFWTDSTAVLGWLNADSSNYHTFIANRIAAIQRITPPQTWRHVRSEDNPADIISRGLSPQQIVNNNFWFYGPKFLHGTISCWPLQPPKGPCSLELRRQANPTTSALIAPITQGDFLGNINHKNCFYRLQRIIAYVLRFIRRRRDRVTVAPGGEEMEEAMVTIVKLMQRESFKEDIKDLEKHRAVKNSSSLSTLTPFIDKDSVIRVGGRLEASTLPYDAKHPILLPIQHPITKLIAESMHKRNLHAGPQALMALIRQRFWPLKLKMLARSVVKNCVQCARAKPALMQQLMGNLPADRVQPSRPFVISGVDYFGPVWTHIKIRGKRPLKAYVAVFCCFATKAIHMELVNDLTTGAFIGALKRFMARRGNCQKLYCDNATNFVGAKNHIKELYDIVHNNESKNRIISECGKSGIEFSFIPPRAPHFGGLWESAVKSAKRLLQGILSSASLTYEEMETVIIEAEAILNSRPITPMSTDPNDLQALTPGHLLIGEPLTSTIDPRARPAESSYPARWQTISHLKSEFWRRWTHEYLSNLQHRYKWKQECQNVTPGTMVILKDDNLPPLKWPLGRIKNVIRGDDGLVRVADVQTASNVTRRAIHKLAPLPVYNQGTEEIDNDNDHDDPIATKRVKLTASSFLSIVLMTIFFLPLCLSTAVEIQPFETNPGIYFEHLGTAGLIASEWNLVTFINMDTYWKRIQVLQGYPNAIRRNCKDSQSGTYCTNIARLLDNVYEEIILKNQILHAHKTSRVKRGAINLVGNLANSLFGILDSQYAEESAKIIDSIKNNEDYVVLQLKNLTSYIDSTVNIMRKSQKSMQNELEQMEKMLSRLQNQIHQEGISQSITELALQITLEMLHIERIQDSLLDVLINTHHGKISPELISPQQLEAELMNVKANLPSNVKLPAPADELLSFYKLMSIEGRLTTDYVIFRVTIPLIMTEPFELLQLSTIPWHSNGQFYKVQSHVKFLVVDLHREQYLPLKESEMSSCTLINSEAYLCQQTHPLYKIGSSEAACEMRLLSQHTVNSSCTAQSTTAGPHWIQLHNQNLWLYSVEKEYVLNAVCGTTPTTLVMNASGILKLSGDCHIKQPLVTIQGHQKFETKRNKFYLPSVNMSEAIRQQMSNMSFQHINTIPELEELHSNLSRVVIELPYKIRPHDVHHYFISYFTLGIVIIGVCLLVRYKLKKNKEQQQERAVQPNPTDEKKAPQEDDSTVQELKVITIYDC